MVTFFSASFRFPFITLSYFLPFIQASISIRRCCAAMPVPSVGWGWGWGWGGGPFFVSCRGVFRVYTRARAPLSFLGFVPSRLFGSCHSAFVDNVHSTAAVVLIPCDAFLFLKKRIWLWLFLFLIILIYFPCAFSVYLFISGSSSSIFIFYLSLGLGRLRRQTSERDSYGGVGSTQPTRRQVTSRRRGIFFSGDGWR
jgi:hypothetical protein